MGATSNKSKLVIATLAMVFASACERSCSRRSVGGDDAPPGGSGASAGIGVPECDAYVDKYARCVADKIPAERKKAFEEALGRTRATWKALAANPGARPGLPQACALAQQTAETTLKPYGCAW